MKKVLFILGQLSDADVDWMTDTPPAEFLAEHALALTGMAVVALVLRPLAVLFSRGLSMVSLVPGIGNLVRWRNHRYVLRQSLSYFQNDFAGRIAQKVTGARNPGETRTPRRCRLPTNRIMRMIVEDDMEEVGR